MVSHAHAQEDKQARRDDILNAALTLFLADMRRFPTVAAIAAEAGLAKGTVYLYFKTKEQIFAALLEHAWQSLFQHVQPSFADRTRDRASMIADFIDRFVGFMDGHPYFLRLDSLGYGVMETNLTSDEFWRFKEMFSSALQKAAAEVDAGLALSPGLGMRLLIRSYALTKGLWQILDYPDQWRSDARFSSHPFAGISYGAELREALHQYWSGALN